MKIINWIKSLNYIVRNYEKDIKATESAIIAIGTAAKNLKSGLSSLDARLAEMTDIGIDVSYRGRDPNHIIIVGRYKNQDFVQTFTIDGDDINYFVNLLKEMERHARVRRVDAPPQMRAAFIRDLKL